jgi:hypothetical protein
MGNAHTFKSDKIGFQVTAITSQSPAASCGLKVMDDFILTINGQDLPFMDPDKIMTVVQVRDPMIWCFAVVCFQSSRVCLEKNNRYINSLKYVLFLNLVEICQPSPGSHRLQYQDKEKQRRGFDALNQLARRRAPWYKDKIEYVRRCSVWHQEELCKPGHRQRPRRLAAGELM